MDLDSAVEEVLRYTSPNMHLMRVAREDVVVGGQLIRAGERVAVGTRRPTGTRPCSRTPDTLRFDRKSNRRLALGHGNHFCIGAGIARVELRALLRVLVDKVGDAHLAGPLRWTRSNFSWGLEHMPVTLRPR